MTVGLLLSLVLAAVASAALAGLYAAWPRPMSAEEWIARRNAAELDPEVAHDNRSDRRLPSFARQALVRTRWALRLVRADLELLRLEGQRSPGSEEDLASELLRLAGLGAGAGLLAGLALWLLAGRQGLPGTAALLAVALGLLLPAVRWVRYRRQAGQLRATIRRRLPRLLTGARVLLESGALTPQQALTTVVSVYADPAADVLREAIRDREVRRVEIQTSLDEVARAYGLETLQRLADSFRVGGRYGTRMADLLVEFAAEVRQGWHAEYRERMTRAPVLMTVPALVFFVLPLLAVVLLLVLYPLMRSLSQL